MNQKNHENEKQYEIYWNEKRTLALQIANWAKNSTDYPAEAVTRFLRQYGGGDIFGRIIVVQSVVIDTIALVPANPHRQSPLGSCRQRSIVLGTMSTFYQIWAHMGRGESLLLRETKYHSVAVMLKDFYLDQIINMEGGYGIEIRTIKLTPDFEKIKNPP